jgi:hypothetical protein
VVPPGPGGGAMDHGRRRSTQWLPGAAVAVALLVAVLSGCSEDDIEGGDCLDLADQQVKVVDCGSSDADVRACGEGVDGEQRFITVQRGTQEPDTVCVVDLP